jgi:predicted dehydrogenase
MTGITAALLGVEHPHSLGHLHTLQQLPEVERILLWDTNPDALAKVKSTQGAKVVGTFTNLSELLATPDLSVVLAALRNDLGPDIFLQVLNAGKHLMAEKPIGRNAADTQRVIDAARAAGVKLAVCYQNRFTTWAQEARSIVQRGLIGPLMSVEMRMITTQVQFRNPKHWLFSNEHAGGGILSWLGCHYIDMMYYLTGDEIVSVMAEVATRSGEAIDVEDVATLSLRFRSGAVGSLHAGYILALSGGGYANKSGYDTYIGVNGRSGRLNCVSIGTPNQVIAESIAPEWRAAPQRVFHFTPGDSPAYGGAAGEQFIRAFLQGAHGQGELPTTGEDALRVARVIDAAYESSRTGRRIEL